MTSSTQTTRSFLPNPDMEIDPTNTALVVTDPQNDFLSPDGVTWEVVGKSVEANNTVENIETLFKLAKASGIQVFISPHYYYPTDKGWKFEGALEKLMHNLGMFDRPGALSRRVRGIGPRLARPLQAVYRRRRHGYRQPAQDLALLTSKWVEVQVGATRSYAIWAVTA